MDRQALLNRAQTTEEKTALAKVLDKAALCEKLHEKTFTDFLDQAKAAKFAEMFHTEDFVCMAVGGSPVAERRMLGFAPEYMELANEDFPIAAVAVKYNAKYSKELTHRDFLGSVLGLGIDRARVGDITLGEAGAVVITAREMADYICVNLEQVGRTKVECEIMPVNFNDEAEDDAPEQRIIVPSLRLDAVISGAFNISRAKSAGLIAGEKAFVNWVCVTNTSKLLAENDMVTVRGLGRVRINKVGGTTKKDRLVLFVRKY